MITLLSPEREADFIRATGFDPVIGARIYTLLRVYGYDTKETCLWLQTYESGAVTAAISRCDGWIVVSADVNADNEELAAFIRMVGGYRNIEASPELCLMLRDIGEYEGSVTMVYTKGEIAGDYSLVNVSPSLEDVYKTICSANEWFRATTDWQAWYPYTSHLIRHELGLCNGIYEDGRLVSTGGVYTIGEKYAVIGGLATLAEYRGRGYAGLILKSLVNEILALGKIPALFCASDTLAGYYASAGFEKYGRWGQITL